MDLVVIPQALLMVYGPPVLGCGAVLGFIAARNVARGRLRSPQPPDDLLERRVRVLEEELESARSDLDRLTSENEFMGRLRNPPSPDDGLTEERRRLDNRERLAEIAQGVTRGDPEAPITIIEFGDYQCPGCGQFALTVKPHVDRNLVETGRAQFIYYDFPLTAMHPNAFLAARAARCAGDQDVYWEYHDQLFRNQSSWAARPSPVGVFLDYGEAVRLDGDTFEACLKSDRHADVVSANMRLGYELGVSVTPTLMVQGNGQFNLVEASFQAIAAEIERVSEAGEPTGN